MTARAFNLLPLACLFAAIAAGCAAGPTQSFDISVHNNAPLPVMIWLSKDGPPAEKGWLTTEQYLQASPGEPSPGVDVPPDKTARTGKVSGKFPQGTHAILEVFGNDRSDAARSKAAGVLTIRLEPGQNNLTVNLDAQGHLTAADTVTGKTIQPAAQP